MPDASRHGLGRRTGAGNSYTLDDSGQDDGYHPLRESDLPGLSSQRAADGEDEEAEVDESALTPIDGYFGSSTDVTGPATVLPRSSQVPYIPDVWVRDPSLEPQSTADSKAREASRPSAAIKPDPLSSLSLASRGLPLSNDAYHPSHPPHHHAYDAETRAPQPAWSASSSPCVATPPSWAGSSRSTESGRRLGANDHASFIYSSQHPTAALQGLPTEAPPAYSPREDRSPASSSPTYRPSHPSSSARHHYRTFPDLDPASTAFAAIMPSHRQYESQGLLAREPESMGGDPEDYIAEEPVPRWRQRLRRRVPFIHSNLCRAIALGLLLFTITMLFLGASLKGLREGGVGSPAPSVPKESSVLGPSNPPSNPSDPSDPSRPSRPLPTSYPPFEGELSFPHPDQCKGGSFEKTDKYFFAAGAEKPLSLRQMNKKDEPGDGAYVNVYGDVLFRRANGDTAITVELKANDESIVVGQQYDAATQSLELKVPRKIAWADRDRRPCLYIRATVTIPEGGVLESLQVSTVSLGVKFLDNLSVGVSKSTLVHTTVGSVAAAVNGENDLDRLARDGAPEHFRLESRFISVKTTSADIVGSWPLFDYLALESTSGAINAGVEPKTAAPNAPRDPKLFIKSTSGNVQFWEPVHQARKVLQLEQPQQQQQQQGMADSNALAPAGLKSSEELIPPRNYEVDVHTTSGDIKGAAAFTYQARIRSTSGTMAVDLLPVLPSELAAAASDAGKAHERVCNLETSSTSGAMALRVLDPFWIGEAGRYSTAPDSSAPSPPGTLMPQPRPPVSPGRVGGDDGGDPERGIVVPVGGGDRYNVPSTTGPAIDVLPVPAARQQHQARQAAAGAEKFLRVLRARHSTTSASLGIRLPGEWEGDIVVDTISGKIYISGEGVKVVESHESLPGFNKHVVARKGDLAKGEGSMVAIKTASGDVDVAVGKVKA